jgi:CRISPR-associated endonuclease/helicase Cas3
MIWAHSRKDEPPDQWQPLDQHLRNVATRAAESAARFHSGDWAQLAGMLHDLGKASDGFQSYLLRSNGLDDSEYDSAGKPSTHSGAGAAWALEAYREFGRILAYPVMGHHAGLPDWTGGKTPNGALCIRQAAARKELEGVRKWAKELLLPTKPPPPPFKMAEREIHLWIRMLYSCLVDADFLDTERFMDPDKFAERRTFPTLEQLAEPFFSRLDAMQAEAENTEVNAIRAEVRLACEAAADRPPGFFSLSVPTGGGKTLSSTAFAFRHALLHGKRRIIYVIPYMSIIEQTADVLRRHFDGESVVEHHSNLDPETQAKAARLASENWDAPVVVTTSVQFFESLLAARSSRCRKLHNIADAVVILDEVQLLPPELLEPCTDMMRQLVERYGVTMVLSTATQPVLPNLGTITEIIPYSARLPERLRRVRYELPDVRENRPRSWEEIAEELGHHPQVLCVVNTRRDCLELFNRLPGGSIHLSATMCGEHRSKVIEAIREKLKLGETIRVASTQLVEAGVDIDFPVVYRALAGLDSIAQSAGRCNREGRTPDGGKVVVFIPPKPAPKGTLRKAEDSARVMLANPVDMESRDLFPRYFGEFYSRIEGHYPYRELLIRDARTMQFQFREAASGFRMIDESQQSVFVRYGAGEDLVEQLRCHIRADSPYGWLLRKLQRYSISLPQGQLAKLASHGQIEELVPGMFVWNGRYSESTGADIFNEEGVWLAEDSVI